MNRIRQVLGALITLITFASGAVTQDDVLVCYTDPEIGTPVGQTREIFAVGQRVRSALVQQPVFAPVGEDPPAVIFLHALGDAADTAVVRTTLGRLASRRGFIIATPEVCRSQSEGGAWNAGGCCGAARREGVDDVGFVLALAARLVREHGANPRRLYLVGESNGGSLLYRVLETDPEPFAAAGVLNAPRLSDTALTAASRDQPKPGLPILIYGFGIEPGMPFVSGFNSTNHDADGLYAARFNEDQNFARLAEANGCPDPQTARFERAFSFQRTAFDGCTNGPVVQYISNTTRPSWKTTTRPGLTIADAFFDFFERYSSQERSDNGPDTMPSDQGATFAEQ